jgi:hypothetical protein
MVTAALSDDSYQAGGEQARRRARAAVHAVADGLTDQGLDILGPEWDGSHCLKATNAWNALCEATIHDNGRFTWEYRAAKGGWTDPAQLAAMTLTLLGASDAGPGPGEPPLRYPGQAFNSAVGLTARAAGMHARLGRVHGYPELLEVSIDIEISNPARPDRGAVHVTDTALRWECRIADPETSAVGLAIQDITETIGRSVPQLQAIGITLPGPAWTPWNPPLPTGAPSASA